MKKQAVVNIYHFIRKSTYEDGIFTEEDFDTLKCEMDILKQHQLPATYALKYDALLDEQYTKLIKSMIDENDEVAAWWEITQEMAEKAGVQWKGRDVIDLNVKAGYSLAYLPEERKALLDVYMEDFKRIYGYYPKTIASWVMDIVTFEYAKERYGLIGGALCRDQIGVDGFTLWGGYFNGAYYPSKVNEYMPAQTKENQLDLPLFRLLGPDPIYNFESGIREGAEGIYSLEPAWVIGQDEKWVNWVFNCLTDEEQVGYGYAQVGQENSYIWGTVGDAFEMQIRHVAKLRKENKVRVETLQDSAKWFAAKYQLTPPTTYTASEDWNKDIDLKTTWYSSRFYRMSLLWDQGELSIRDLYLFNEDYASRYLNTFITHNESVFDALPILNTHYWSTEEKRASIDFVDGDGIKLKGNDPRFMADNDDETWYVEWQLDDGRELSIVCEQDKVGIEMLAEEGASEDWMIVMNALPVLKTLTSDCLLCEHEGFTYELRLSNGSFEKREQGICIVPVDDKITMLMGQKTKQSEMNIFTSEYLKDREAFDAKVTMPVRVDEEKLSQVKLIKPLLSHQSKVKKYDEVCHCEMRNLNEVGEIRYTLDGTEPIMTSPLYVGPIAIKEDTEVKARCFAKGRPESDTVVANYYNTFELKGITTTTHFDPRKVFNRQGVLDLIDGKKGSTNFVDGAWLGTQESIDVTVDLGEMRPIKAINIGFLQSRRSGLVYPEYVEFSISADGEHFEVVDKQNVYGVNGNPDMEKKDVIANCDRAGRYVRIYAKRHNYFLFADQIIVQG